MDHPRRVLLAFVLMALVLAASQWWYGRTVPPAGEDAPAEPAATDRVVEGEPPAPPAPLPAAPDTVAADTAGPDTAAAGPAPAAAAPDTAAPAPSPVVVTTPLYEATIDPRGGTLTQVVLSRYPSFSLPGPVRLVPPGASFLRRAADLGGERLGLEGVAFAAADSAIRLAAGDPARVLTLEGAAGGRRVVQTYRFDPATYVIDYALNLGAPVEGVLVTGIGPRLLSNEKNPRDDYGQLRAVLRVDGDIASMSAGDVDEGPFAVSGAIDWAGLKNKYFLGMVLAAPGGPPLAAATVEGAEGDSLPTLQVAVAAPIREGRSAYRVYFGPQEYRRLAGLNDGLDDVNQYGWSWIRWMITPFAKLIVVIMLWLHRFIPSYGLVLIVFGILVRIVMWPLTTKSYQSIQAMQKLQPELQRIREAHKSDPQKMQQETMRLYREKKVNPLGGCLPNLIPMPILFALFFVFQGTIELRNQPFLWLPDLSQPDPIYILPVLMGLTMYMTSKLTATDPRMTAMTYLMPIVLTFVFLNLAAGLVLYYAFSNLLTFVQQWWLKRAGDAREAAEAEAGPG